LNAIAFIRIVEPYMILIESIFELIYLALWVLEWEVTELIESKKTISPMLKIDDLGNIFLYV
jgi:hypothetical protein